MKRSVLSFVPALAIVAGLSATAQAAIIYDASVQTGSRVNVGQAGFFGAATVASNSRILFDDVPISNLARGAATALEVTRVTVGIRQVAGAPATSVSLYWSSLTTNVTSPDTQIDTPSNLIGNANLGAVTASVTSLVSIGDGVNPIFTVPFNTDLITGFGSFAVGVQLGSTDGLNGWRATTPAVGFANAASAVWAYDAGGISGLAGSPTEFGPFGFGAAPNPPATFYIVVEGNFVPTPGAAVLLGLSGLIAARRRRN